MQHATATITHLPAHQLQAALNIAHRAAPERYMLTNWQATGNGTYHVHATLPAFAHPQHTLAVARRIVAAWAEAGLCANGRSTTAATLNQGA